jgi:outer membrane lipoprotein-sorting protein
MHCAQPEYDVEFSMRIDFLYIFRFMSAFVCVFYNATVFADVNVSADSLLEKYDSIMGPENFESTATMTATREDGTTRTYRMKFLKKGNEKFRVWFQGPAAVAGQEVLRVGENSWVYLPNLKRATRIANRDSFQGGDFNNADVLRVNYKADYTAVMGQSAQSTQWLVELKANGSGTAYDAIKLWIRKSDFMPLRGEYFGTSGKILRSAVFSDFKQFAKNYMRPGRVVMKNELITARQTELVTLAMEVGVNPPSQRFSLSNLGK